MHDAFPTLVERAGRRWRLAERGRKLSRMIHESRVRFALVAAAALLLVAADADAQEAVAGADTAALVVQNRVVFVFRAPLGARSSAERAAAAANRIRRLAEQRVDENVVASRIPEGVLLSAGGQPVFAILPGDIAPGTGDSIEQVGVRASRSLADALKAEREQRSLSHTLWGLGAAALATLFFVVLLRLLGRSRSLLVGKLPFAAASRLRPPSIGNFTLVSAEQMLWLVRRVLEALSWGIGLFAAYLWLTFLLTRFPYSEPWGNALGEYLVRTVKQLALTAVGAVPGLFTVVLIFFAARFLTRVLAGVFKAVESGELQISWVHVDTVKPTRKLLTAVLWLFAVIVAYPYLPGSGTDVFKGVSVLVGLMLSLGSSGIVNQAMSGLVLMYARALRPGDYVRVNDTEGTVAELGMLSTKIRTNKQELVTIPNAVLVGTTTKNFSRGADGVATGAAQDGVLLYTSVTIGYDVPWRQVHALLIEAAGRTEGLRSDPRPFVRQSALADFYVEYQLNAHLEHPERRIQVLSDLHANIQDCFNEQSVQIMSPHYENDPAQPKIPPSANRSSVRR